MSILLIRHGKTYSNIKKVYMGQTDEPLSTQGCEELKRFVESGLYPTVVKTFSSPLLRCLQTAEIIYPDEQPTVIDDLRELHFGTFEGMTYEEVSKLGDASKFFNMDYTFPEGENMGEFAKRCIAAFSDLSHLQNVAIFSHGGVIMTLMSHLFKEPFYNFYVQNGCGYMLFYENDSLGNEKLSYKPIIGEL